MGGAFEKLFVSRLEPVAGMLSEKRRRKEAKDAEEDQEQWELRRTKRGWQALWHVDGHRMGRLREIIPVTGPPSGMEDSEARDSRRIWTLPVAGRPSRTLIWSSGTLGSSLSSQRMVGEGAKRPT